MCIESYIYKIIIFAHYKSNSLLKLIALLIIRFLAYWYTCALLCTSSKPYDGRG